MTEPIHLNVASLFVALFGSYRTKILFDLIIRQQHAYPLLRAAEEAKASGLDEVSVIEFGVATGAGLMNIASICEKLTRDTGVKFKIFGFDTGVGLPEPKDFRDHPEYYAQGDFKMDFEKLKGVLPKNCQLIIGDIAETISKFMEEKIPPIAFVSIDVDYYSSTTACLNIFKGSDPTAYLPLVYLHLDDVELENHSEYTGELLACVEFSRENEKRKISRLNYLRNRMIFKNAAWIDKIFAVHVLDHPRRSRLRNAEQNAHIDNPYLGR